MATKHSLEILDQPEIAGVLFHPRRDFGLQGAPVGSRSVRVAVDGELSVGGCIFAAAADNPVIVYFHGNGEIAADYASIAEFYTRLGLTLFVFDYRGYGSSDGMPSASALLTDATTCFTKTGQVLAEAGIAATGPLFLMGRSLGSAAALEVAANPDLRDQVAGLIIESGFADTFALIERLGLIRIPNVDEAHDGFANEQKIASVTVPTLILHGERDTIIPVEEGRALYEASASSSKRLLTVPGAGHNDIMMVGHQTYFGSIAEFCGGALPPQT